MTEFFDDRPGLDENLEDAPEEELEEELEEEDDDAHRHEP